MTQTKRNPEATRQTLVNAAFWEIYRHGFQAASLDSILRSAGVTKGALYHHFPNKKILGLAVIDEVIEPHFRQHWFGPIESAEDPITGIQKVIGGFVKHEVKDAIELGCPLNNLAQEMSPIDEDFRIRIETIFGIWKKTLADALRRGQSTRHIVAEIDADKVASFIVAAVEGAFSMAKNSKSADVLRDTTESLGLYLQALRTGN